MEKCDVSQGDWITVSASCTKTSFRMTKLTPGKEYGFRVRAENRFGISEPIYSEKMIARYPFGESELKPIKLGLIKMLYVQV